MMSKFVRLALSSLLVLGSAAFLNLEAQDSINREGNLLLADPTIIHYKDSFYVYGTGGNNANQGFVVFSAPDFLTWKRSTATTGGYALKKGDAFGDRKFWAPQVFLYKGKFYMAYAANERIAIARGYSPLGPFKQDSLLPLPADTKQIDPFVFIDTDGKIYLYHVVVANGANRIYVVQINDDLCSVKKETLTLCIEADKPWENKAGEAWKVTEGPTVIKHKNLYYLLYSANHFLSPDYSVGYAVSISPLGPWKKYGGNPILSRDNTGQNGSGHGDVVQDGKGNWYYIFHTHYSSARVGPRKTAMVQMKFIRDKKTGIDKIQVDPGSFHYLQQVGSRVY